MLDWATSMLAYDARPPDPAVVGDGWRDAWLARLEGNLPFIERWLGHQRRDDYWLQGSVCTDFGAIRCPVYVVSGWADSYRNRSLRLLEGLDVPRKGLIGPWAHTYPEQAAPGPAIGFLQESLRWWDRWLKGTENGIDERAAPAGVDDRAVRAGPPRRATLAAGSPSPAGRAPTSRRRRSR